MVPSSASIAKKLNKLYMSSPEHFQTKCKVLSNECLQGSYWRMRLEAPEICNAAVPGQFVHLQVPQLEGHLLRRPFSICDVNDTVLAIVYKVVGAGTDAMQAIQPNAILDILGPLGHGFAPLPDGRTAYMLGGGYGCAAMLFAAHRAVATGKTPPHILLGARSKGDILLVDEFTKLGCPVEISTDDGSLGVQGRITVLVEKALQVSPDAILQSCGPRPMLKAVAMLAEKCPDCVCEVSLDERMCCGVGACFGCVVKAKDPSSSEGWKYLRSCKEGPVFKAEEILW